MHNTPDSLCVGWQVDRLGQQNSPPAVPSIIRFQQLYVVERTLATHAVMLGSTPQLTVTVKSKRVVRDIFLVVEPPREGGVKSPEPLRKNQRKKKSKKIRITKI